MVKEFNYRNYNKVKFYYGIVNEVLENYSVRFRIPEIIDNLDDDEYPIAHPILKHTSEIFKNDTIIIMQLDVDMQEFVYFSNDVTEFTGLRFGHNIIDLSLGKEDNPSLSIKVVSLDDDDGNLEEGEEWIPAAPYTEINCSDTAITITKSTPKDDDTTQKDDNVVVTIDDTGINAVVNKIEEGKGSVEKSGVNIADDGTITLTATPDTGKKSSVLLDANTLTLSAGDSTKSTITLENSDSAKKIEAAASSTTKATIDGQTSKIEMAASSTVLSTIDGQNNKIVHDTGTGSKQTIDGSNGVKIESVTQSSLNLGALIELKNIAGGLQGLLDDLWTELSTVNNNLLQLATMTSTISYAGPGALINATGGAIAGPSASIGTINAKKALVSAVLQ